MNALLSLPQFSPETADLSEVASSASTNRSGGPGGEPEEAARKAICGLPSEQRDLRGHPRPQGDHHSEVARPRIAAAHDFLQDKHDCRGRHISVVPQYRSGETELGI